MTIRDLNRAMDWDLPDEDAVTVAGLVIHEAQTIPDPGQTFIFHRHRFQVLRRQRNQITALRVSAHQLTAGRRRCRKRVEEEREAGIAPISAPSRIRINCNSV